MVSFYRVVQITKERRLPLICPGIQWLRAHSSRIMCLCSGCNRIVPHVHILQLLKVIGMTLEQTPRELSVLLSIISPLGELPCNGVCM